MGFISSLGHGAVDELIGDVGNLWAREAQHRDGKALLKKGWESVQQNCLEKKTHSTCAL